MSLHKNMKFSMKEFCQNLVTFNAEILNEKIRFCAVNNSVRKNKYSTTTKNKESRRNDMRF